MMIVFTLTLLVCPAADTCRWFTADHVINESLCHEIGREYLTEPTVIRYKCTANAIEVNR